MQETSGFTLITIALPIALLIFGVAFVKFGFWPRRSGATPHCRRCGYVLVGNQSGTCPECGQAWTDATVILGERHRQKPLGFTGLILLLLGIAIGGGLWLTDINWYQYMPQQLVVADAASPDPKIAQRAWDELM